MVSNAPRALAIALAATLTPVMALADLDVRFDEGAPKDRFSFVNTGACTIENATLLLDLSGSSAGLIFDVTAQGAGVEVFQPLEITRGADGLAQIPRVRDGDNRIAFDLARLDPGASLSFTIDVDDTIGAREITVSDSEIEGASVTLTHAGKSSAATFTNRARATLDLTGCA